MAVNYNEVIKAIEDLAPPFLQASWDCSGLQLASTRKQINKLAVCLDAVPDLLEKALDQGCDFVLAHHPLTLKAELPNRINTYWRILRLLLTQDIPLYSAHTSLDVNINGPAGFLGRALKLQNTEILDPLPSSSFHTPCGYGQVGDLPEPLSLNKLVSQRMEI